MWIYVFVYIIDYTYSIYSSTIVLLNTAEVDAPVVVFACTQTALALAHTQTKLPLMPVCAYVCALFVCANCPAGRHRRTQAYSRFCAPVAIKFKCSVNALVSLFRRKTKYYLATNYVVKWLTLSNYFCIAIIIFEPLQLEGKIAQEGRKRKRFFHKTSHFIFGWTLLFVVITIWYLEKSNHLSHLYVLYTIVLYS